MSSLAEELIARLPLALDELEAVASLAPLGVAANALIRVAPASTDQLFEGLCARTERMPRAARLDALLRLDAVTAARRARLVADGRADGPVAADPGAVDGDLRQRIRSTTDPLRLPARHASTVALIAPEVFGDVVRFARHRIIGGAWEVLAVLTADDCDLAMGDVIELATKL